MDPIISGSTSGRTIRAGLMALFVLGFSAWSLTDGFVRYPQQNVRLTLRDMAGVEPPDPLPAVDPGLTAESISILAEGDWFEDAKNRLGSTPFPVAEDTFFFFGNGGYLEVRLRDGVVEARKWVEGPAHSATDLRWQKIVGFGLLPAGVVALVWFLSAATARVMLSDAGLKIGRRPTIPFDAMTELREVSKTKDRCIELIHSAGGAGRAVRMDDYSVAKFNAIVDVLCRRKGFDNPFAPVAKQNTSSLSTDADSSESGE